MKKALTLVILVASFASCDKAEEAKSIHDDLRNGRWRQVSGTVHVVGRGQDTVIDYFKESIPDCIKDDYFVFKANFDGVVNDDTLKCGVGDPQESAFTWEVKDKDTKMNIFNAPRYFGTSSVYGDILSISANRFSITYVVHEQQTPGIIDTLTYENTYSKF